MLDRLRATMASEVDVQPSRPGLGLSEDAIYGRIDLLLDRPLLDPLPAHDRLYVRIGQPGLLAQPPLDPLGVQHRPLKRPQLRVVRDTDDQCKILLGGHPVTTAVSL